MKKTVFTLSLTFAMFIFVQNIQAQSIESILDNALSLSNQGNNNPAIASLLGQALPVLEQEASTPEAKKSGFGAKLLSQVGVLKNIIPLLATAGLLKSDALGKVLNSIKLLIAGNRLSSLLSGGKSGLAANAGALVSNLSILKGATSALGSEQQANIGSLLDTATKAAGKLASGKKGLFGLGALFAKNKANSSIGSIVGMLGNAIQ